MNQSIALGTRDFDNQTAAKLANLSMEPLGNGRRHIDDEMGRAAEAAAYARAHVDAGDDDDLFDSDEAYAAATVYSSTRRDAGNGLLMTTARTRREEGFDEDLELDEDEDDDEFAEGNDEYPLAVPQDEE
jgi:hypothetical protein